MPINHRGINRLMLFLAAIFITFISILYTQKYLRHIAHDKMYTQIETSLRRIYSKKPSELSEREWDFIVGWTNNAIGNCLIHPDYIVNESRFKWFAHEIDLKSNNTIDVEVIEWIWDELEAISKYGPRYSVKWRPTSPERLREAESNKIEPF